jgi:oxygen-independent coproporphyrinogen-3 oxidase
MRNNNHCYTNNELPGSLYIHVPFCLRKCLYCDFTSYPYNGRDARRYLAGLRGEIGLRTGGRRAGRVLATIFIGGGTPTCLSSGAIMEIISIIKEHFILSPGVEFTIEANPGTVDRDKLNLLRRAGVNRLSLGAQACSGKTLRTLGRIHTHEQTIEAVRRAREAGFDNINLDLIFGVPGQTPREWRDCLEQIAALRPDHVAAYGLQLEEGTPLKAMIDGGQLVPCDEDIELEMYRDAVKILTGAGLYRYEISNFARPGRECRHNLVYWHNCEYLGVGPAAHSYIKRERSANEQKLDKYMEKLAAGKLPVAWSEPVTPENEIFETVFLGLRLAAGLNMEHFRRRFGCSLEDVYPGVAERLVEKGMLEQAGKRLRLTRRGLELANQVMAEFVPPTNS